jgi:hypothetical protein
MWWRAASSRALAYRATGDDPRRFKRSRAVEAYVELTTRRYASGEFEWTGHISNCGDAGNDGPPRVAFLKAFSFEPPLGCQARSCASCTLGTSFLLFDRAILFMRPPHRRQPSVGWHHRYVSTTVT